jgi:hypothetical protein
MVGPGEVDDDLEPEVKDECNTKYGEVVRVVIFEQPNVPSDEAVRIFVEFRRIESAIKGELKAYNNQKGNFNFKIQSHRHSNCTMTWSNFPKFNVVEKIKVNRNYI